MRLTIEHEMEAEGRWIAEIPELPGVMVYGTSPEDATKKVQSLAFLHLHELIDHGEMGAVAQVVFVRTS